MTILYGLFWLDGRPVTKDALARARRTIATQGRQACSERGRGPVRLGQGPCVPAGDTGKHQGGQPSRGDAVMLAASARLDNRDELCGLLGVPGSERGRISGVALVQRAFARWGEDCPRHLYGDWAFAAWDPQRRRLFLARDQMGITGLFWFHRPPLFAFASTVSALLAIDAVPVEIDEDIFLRHLDLAPVGRDHTFWRGVRALLPAHTLAVTPQGLETTRYWSLGNIPTIHLPSERDYVESFLERYRSAVTARLSSQGPVGSTLSAGLDSGSVTALAARALRAQGRGLTAFTAVPQFPADHLCPGALADEWPLAHAVTERYPNIEHVPIDAAKLSPLTAVQRTIDLLGDLPAGVGNLFWICALMEEARSRQLSMLLTGQMGNGGVSWHGGRDLVLYRFIRGDWDAGWRAMVQWRKRQGRSWFAAVRHHLLRPLGRPVLRGWQGVPGCYTTRFLKNSALRPEIRRRLGTQSMRTMRNSRSDLALPTSPRAERLMMLELNSNIVGAGWHGLSLAFDVPVSDPTADVRLLEYCFGVPNQAYAADGGDRMLLRRAMSGILPPPVQWNQRRGRQGADLPLRLVAHGEEMESTLARLGSSPIGEYLDWQVVRESWTRLNRRELQPDSVVATGLLLHNLAAGLFLEAANGRRHVG